MILKNYCIIEALLGLGLCGILSMIGSIIGSIKTVWTQLFVLYLFLYSILNILYTWIYLHTRDMKKWELLIWVETG